MTISIEHIEFQTAADLIAAIEKLAGPINLSEIYMKDIDGNDLSEIALEQETLSDNSVVYNLILSEASDRNS